MNVRDIPITDIKVSEFNTRKDQTIDEEDSDMNDLINSIKENGLLQPITVREKGKKYEIIAGQRRYQACKQLDMSKIPCNVLKDISNSTAITLSLTENVHRSDMKPLDKAKAYLQLYDDCTDWDIVANKVGVKPQTIKKYTDMLNLSPKIQDKIIESEGNVGIDVLSKLAKTFPDTKEQEQVYDEIQGFSQGVGKEILKQCGGDKKEIPELVKKAQKGEFKQKSCFDGLCFDMSDELKTKVIQMILKEKDKTKEKPIKELQATNP